jgi:hypothetical protein
VVEQCAGGLLDALSVGLTARGALGVGRQATVEAARLVGRLGVRGPRTVRGPIPAARTPVSACRLGPCTGRTRCFRALALAGGALDLLVGGVSALDGLLEPGQRRRDVRARELAQRLATNAKVGSLA